MGNGEVELPHLLRCKGCGVPNGRNAELCWSCGAGLGAAARKRATPSIAPARTDAASSAGPEQQPAGDVPTERASARFSAARPDRSLPATVVIALALAGVVALWSPRSDRPSQERAATSAAIEPLHAGAAPLLGAPSRRAKPAAEPGVRERAASAQQAAPAPPLNPQQAAWALGLAADAATSADSAAAADGCRDVDRTLGLCASEAAAAEQR